MDQVEFEQQLAAGEKAQMMQKLDMLLTTRGEPMETIEMVRVQTELEVEVRNLKETVQRLQHQLEAARNEVRMHHCKRLACTLCESVSEGKCAYRRVDVARNDASTMDVDLHVPVHALRL